MLPKTYAKFEKQVLVSLLKSKLAPRTLQKGGEYFTPESVVKLIVEIVEPFHGRILDVLTLQRGFDLPHKDRREGIYPVVSSSGVTGYHDEYKSKGPGVVTGRYGTLGEVYYIPGPYWPLNTSLSYEARGLTERA